MPLFAQLPAGVERHRYGHDGSDPVNLVAAPDGVLWAASSNVTVLNRFDAHGIQTHLYLPFEAFTSDLTIGPDGALWLAGSVIEDMLTILDPVIAPVASVEQLNTVPRRRIARR